MKIALAAGLLAVANAAAVPSSSAPASALTSTASARRGFASRIPVAAADTEVVIQDLGIAPAVLKVPVKPNPNFTPNVTNAVAAAQAKYVIVEERLQQEKRDLLARQLQDENADYERISKREADGDEEVDYERISRRSGETDEELEKRRLSFRVGFKPASKGPNAAALSAAAGLNLPCAYFPAFCKTTTTTAAATTSAKVVTPTIVPALTTSKVTTTSSTTSSTSTKPTTSSTSTTTSTSTSAKPTTTSTTSTTSTSIKPTTTSTTSTTSTSIKSTTSTSLTTSSSSAPVAVATLLTLAADNIQLDSEFLSEISIGSNGNQLDMVMDTGSADLWMFSTDCVGCSSNHDFYNPSLSTTFLNTTTKFSLAYGDGSKTSGLLGFDTVTVAGAPIQAQSIDVAHTISASLQSNTMDGILGLGFPSLMSVQGVTGVTTPIANMITQGLIPNGKFGLQYIKSDHWSYNGGGGAWTFGGYDASVVSGALNTVSLTHAQYWMISMDKVSVGSAYSYTPTQNVIVDSGTTLILLDGPSVAKIHSYLPGGRVSPDNSHYQIFCNASDAAYAGSRNAYFTIGGQKYGVPAIDLAWYPEASTPGYCYSGIQPWSNNFGILGVMFLKNVYAVFDQTNSAFSLGARTDVPALTD